MRRAPYWDWSDHTFSTVVNCTQVSSRRLCQRSCDIGIDKRYFPLTPGGFNISQLQQMSSATTSLPTTVNTSPFFPEPTLFNPPPDPDQAKRDLAKDVVIYIIVSVTGGIILLILLKRYFHLKRTNRPLSHFFPWPWRKSNRASSPPAQGQSRTYPRMQSRSTDFGPYVLPYASPPPNIHDPSSFDDDIRYPITAASLQSLYCSLYPSSPSAPYHYPRAYMTNQHQRSIRTRAVNTDEQGRRLDSNWDPDQLGFNPFDTGGHAEDITKEALPAYDRFGGPPNYADVEMEMDIASRAMAEPDRVERLDEDTDMRRL